MTRIQIITLFLHKARAWDAQQEEAQSDPKVTRITRYARLSLFEIHALMVLAGRGEGYTITAGEMQLERRQFQKTAVSATTDLRNLAGRGYINEVADRKFSLTEKGVRFVNAVIS
jgi:hypothetical protein